MYFYQYALKMVDNLFFLFTASFQTRLHFAERIKPQDVSCCGVISFYCLFSLFLKNSKIEKSNGVRSGDLACQISLLAIRLGKLFEKFQILSSYVSGCPILLKLTSVKFVGMQKAVTIVLGNVAY
jgi:hypothetical protein